MISALIRGSLFLAILLGACALSSPVTIWWLELFVHFGLYFLILTPFALIVHVIAYRRKQIRKIRMVNSILCCLVIALETIPVILPYYLHSENQIESASEEISVMFANLGYGRGNLEAFGHEIERRNPDIIALVEFDKEIKKRLPIVDKYPYAVESLESGLFSLGVYSRFKPRTEPIHNAGEELPPVALVEFETLKNNPFYFGALHLIPPLDKNSFLRDRLLTRRVGTIYKHLNVPGILVGDFNATQFSPVYGMLTGLIGLKNAQWSHGLQSTWKADALLPKLTIDHAFVTQNIKVISWEKLPNFGSDHNAISVSVGIPVVSK